MLAARHDDDDDIYTPKEICPPKKIGHFYILAKLNVGVFSFGLTMQNWLIIFEQYVCFYPFFIEFFTGIHNLSTPLLRQDMTQGQFLSGV